MFLTSDPPNSAEVVMAVMAVFGVVLSILTAVFAAIAAGTTWDQLKQVKAEAARQIKESAEERRLAELTRSEQAEEIRKAEAARVEQTEILNRQLKEMASTREDALRSFVVPVTVGAGSSVARARRLPLGAFDFPVGVKNIGPGPAMNVVVAVWNEGWQDPPILFGEPRFPETAPHGRTDEFELGVGESREVWTQVRASHTRWSVVYVRVTYTDIYGRGPYESKRRFMVQNEPPRTIQIGTGA